MAKAATKKTAKTVVKKTTKPRKKAKVKEVDPKIRKALQRRYGIKSEMRRGGRYSTPAEIAEKPEVWDGDASDLLEEEIEHGSE